MNWVRKIRQHYRKKALMKRYAVTNEQLTKDMELTKLMRKEKWDSELQLKTKMKMINERMWQYRYIRRLKKS